MKQKEMVLELPLDEIKADPTFNVRKNITVTDPEIAALAADIAERGLLENLVVREVKFIGRCEYHLVAGFRRYVALQMNGTKNARCLVRVYESDLDAYFANMAENIHRKGLRVIEVVDRCQFFHKEMKLPVDRIAANLKISTPTIYHYLAIASKLHPKILEEIRQKDCGETVSQLFQLTKVDPEVQIEAWNTFLGRTLPRPPGLGGLPLASDPKARGVAPKMRKRDEIQEVLDIQLKDAEGIVGDDDDLTSRDKKIIRTMLKWVLGHMKIFPLKLPPEEVEPDEEAVV